MLGRTEKNMLTVKEYFIVYLDRDDTKSMQVFGRTAREALSEFIEDEGEREVLFVLEWVSGRVQVRHEVKDNKIITT